MFLFAYSIYARSRQALAITRRLYYAEAVRKPCCGVEVAEALWTLDEYGLTPSGESPIRAFLATLGATDRVEAFALIQLARERGNMLRLPHSKALGDGLHELRGKQVRIFYTFRPGRRIVLLEGLVKKRDDIPPVVLRRIRKIQETIT